MKGDFIGFKFGNIRTENLGITRVSGGDRYEEQLHPEVKDITAEVPGMDGEYYFGSTFGTRTFDLEIAYDSLTEEQFRKIRQIFGTKDIKRLIFDERPYKYYMVKIESPIELSYICFDEPKKMRFSELYPNEELPDGVRMVDNGEGDRTREEIDPWVSLEGTQHIYKGEGKITFKAYYPFAKSVYKAIPSEEEESDWVISSGMFLEDKYIEKKIDKYDNGIFKVYNPGDIETGFRLYCPFNLLPLETSHTIPANSENDIFSISDSKYVRLNITSNSELKYTYTINKDLNQIVFSNLNDQDVEVTISYFTYTEYANLSLVYNLNNETIGQLYFNSDTIEPIGEDEGFLIDTNNQLIIGVTNFSIDVSGNAMYSTTGNLYNQYVNGGYFFKLQPTIDIAEIEVTNGNENMKIFYDYLYF